MSESWEQRAHIEHLRANDLDAENKRLRDALKPFAHPDLSELLGGNCEAGESIVFRRKNATLKIKHFKVAENSLKGEGEATRKLCDCRTGDHSVRTLLVVDDDWFKCPRCGGFIKRPKNNQQRERVK